MAAWLNRITVSASWANTVKLAVQPGFDHPESERPNTIPNPTRDQRGSDGTTA